MINLLILLVTVYSVVGAVVSVLLAFVGLGRIDPVAAHAPWFFRLMVLPGLAGLWPVMLVKWARAEKGGGA
ncbi:hypothetical protein OT109_18495 [Phycisphaeraceae bacterium D3-23]